MNPPKDETGKRYGSLLVLERKGSYQIPAGPDAFEGSTHALWLCRCDCGKEVIKRGRNLRQRIASRCGRWCQAQERNKLKAKDLSSGR